MDQEKIWAHFQGTGVHSFELAEPRYEALAKEALRRCQGTTGRVLNIGIGSGGVEKRMLAAGWSVASLDPDSAAVARMRSLGVDAKVGLAQNIPLDSDSFDVAVVSEVLEHIPDAQRQRALGEFARILKPGGFLLVTVPNKEDLAGSETVCPACGNVFHRWGHVTSYDKEKLRAEISPHLAILHCSSRAFVNWRTGRSARRLMKNCAKWVLGRLGEGIVSPSLFLVARKAPRHEPE